ncbi:EmrB/QacA subfamily drug resistance transporter [Terracoccus luteus]|uniref:EmrB/QacA subfamily drug resistance transporter n=1 Tax=Terracoccus luteus TaxID=53356 RepID=A0A495XXC8_9MICO|nr:MDR family MFS transporter [Terracoccus luteus]RKT79241.1 EmrB/QacA subfamily drug resistance transporter [Terracoccus luteus]
MTTSAEPPAQIRTRAEAKAAWEYARKHPAPASDPASDATSDATGHGDARTAPGGGPALSHREIVTILIGLMMGMFLAALDQTIVASAMRVIADDLQDLAGQAWVTTAYLITSTIVTPLYGKLGDIYGRKKLFLFAISIFTIGSVLCTLAWSIPSLAGFRAIQGLGAGGLFSLSLAIIGDIVPPRERAKYQGYFLAVFGTSSVLGPVIGGFFAGQDTLFGVTGWRWVFLVNAPIAVAALIVVTRTLHLKHTRLDHRIDYWGAATLSIALVPLLIVAEQGREWGWGSASSIVCYAIGAAGATAFFVIEKRMGDEALIPLRLFSNRTIGAASVSSVFIGMGMFGGLAALPLYLQIVKGATPTEAGLMLLPMTLGIMSGSITSGQIISRTGRYRKFPIIGAALLVLSLYAFHWVNADTELWKTMIVMFFFGIGLGFNFQPLTLAVQNAAARRDIGVATSSATFTRQIGGTLGTAVFLSILFSQAGSKIGDAFQRASSDASFQAALKNPTGGDPAANAQFIASLKSNGGGAGTSALTDSSFVNQIDPRLARPFLVGFSDAMSTVFVVAAGVLVLAFVATLFLPHVDLGPKPGESAQQQEEGEPATAVAGH